MNEWPAFPSPNERARAYQAIALVTRGSVAIDGEIALYGAMEDVAAHEGRLYPNKAPGLLPLLLPAAALATLAPTPEGELRWTLYLGRLLSASLPHLVTALLLASITLPRWPRGGRLVVTTWTLATPAFAASLLLFAHSLTALLLLAGYAALWSDRPSVSRYAIAGALLGWAVCCEYQLVVPVGVMAVARATAGNWRRTVALACGTVPPLALLALYNTVCFGSPFALSSGHEANPAFATLASKGVFGIGWPSAAGVVSLLLSPSRGLLIWVPLLGLAAGPLRPRTPDGVPNGRAALLLAPCAAILMMSGYPNWHGGWFPGPRYLLAVVPLLMVAASARLERLLAGARWAAVIGAANAWGLVMVWPITAAFPFPPTGEPLPSLTLAPRWIADGALFPSWLSPPAAAVVWGFAGLAVVGLSIAATGNTRKGLIGGVLAMTVAFVASRTPLPSMWPAPLARAVAHDVYSGAAPGELEGLLRETSDESRRSLISGWIERRDRRPRP